MWNHSLLKAAADSKVPVLIKRGLGATTIEWIKAGLRLAHYGASEIVFCERGFRAGESLSRNTIDFCELMFLKEHLPVPLWVDVSHSSGCSLGAIIAAKTCLKLGFDGVMLETHSEPLNALCDSDQAVNLKQISSGI